MAKDPAFLFYYDRFLSGTISMTNDEVGQYIRLMCIQANKGFITRKDMMNICKSYDNDVCLKFQNIGPDKFANPVLDEVLQQRRNYTESRRNNRKGNKKEKPPDNISSSYDDTYDNHMVNVNVNVNKDVNVNGKRGAERKPKQPVILPFNTPAFKTTWQAWVAYRAEMRKPLTPISQQAALKKLSIYPEHIAIQMIEQSIANGWQGIFPLSNLKQNGNGERTIGNGITAASSHQRRNSYPDQPGGKPGV